VSRQLLHKRSVFACRDPKSVLACCRIGRTAGRGRQVSYQWQRVDQAGETGGAAAAAFESKG